MPESHHLTILQLNDSHGYLEPHPEVFWRGGGLNFQTVGGFARIATLFNEAQLEHHDAVLTLDNGDTLHGTFAAVYDRGKAMVPILNAMAFDGMTAHWEFAYGPANFQALTHTLNYPMLAINCYEKETRTLIFSPSTIIERGGLQIGIIGIAANTVDKTMPPSFSEGVYFTLGNQELPDYIEHMREKEKVDLIVLLSHLGYPQDLKLAAEVNGIDLLLSSHTHNRLQIPVVVNNTIIIQSGSHGSFIGQLDLELRDNQIKKAKHKLLTVKDSIKPNPAVQKMIERVLKPHRSMLDTVVGETRTLLSRWRNLESTMDNLLLQSILDATDTEIAFSNGWRFGAPIAPGKITMNDLWNIIPDNPPISVCELTGEEMLQMMEDNLENTYSRDPYRQMGGYLKRILGVNIYFKLENPYRKRIHDFYVGGNRLDQRKSYQVAYLTVQSIPARYGRNHRELSTKAVDALKDHLAENSPVTVPLRGTLIPI